MGHGNGRDQSRGRRIRPGKRPSNGHGDGDGRDRGQGRGHRQRGHGGRGHDDVFKVYEKLQKQNKQHGLVREAISWPKLGFLSTACFRFEFTRKYAFPIFGSQKS